MVVSIVSTFSTSWLLMIKVIGAFPHACWQFIGGKKTGLIVYQCPAR
jgi:hypothetical protein